MTSKEPLARRLFAPVRGEGRHFFLIDLVRGFAALAVVIFHYQNFAIPAGSIEQVLVVRDAMPWRTLLWPIYDFGLFAVQLFWLISGFVFTGVYVGHAHTTRYFVASRIARLYPLHLITLLVVAGLQFGRLGTLGNFAIYQANDTYHFVLHLFMASDWGFQRAPSFNAPIWSVSLEILIYAIFWLIASRLYRFGLIGPFALAGAFAMGSIFNFPGTLFWQCGFYFFLGSAAHCAYIVAGKKSRWLAIPGIAGLGLVAALLVVHPAIGVPKLMPAILPSLFLIICSVESSHLVLPKWARAIGDMTYGVYLWHVPLMLTAMLVLDGIIGSRRIVLQPGFLIAYAAVIALIGALSFYLIERPAKRALMRLLEGGMARKRQGI
ncbi:MAG: acyltransferase [Candidatus Sphingomonas phytovorans]|nr:acyltransferase [Sphingomonas sp.]WEJ98349.1 MAG: acyltransferase [Sphingomonas sp.]